MTLQELEKASPFDGFWNVRDQLKCHIHTRSHRAFDAGDAARDAITTPEALQKRQREVREFFPRCLGGLPPLDTPLNARVTGSVEGRTFKVEKIIYESRPKHYVTASLYLPHGLKGPQGAVLFLCGHWGLGRLANQYQMVCHTLAQAGLIVLAQDPVGQGERWSYYESAFKDSTVEQGVYEHDYAGIQARMIGDGIARYFLHDAMRSIDYLRSRPEVDSEKIGVTGNSGGGTQTGFLMMCDPRIAAAAPGTFLMNRRTYLEGGGAQDCEQIWRGFTAAGYDHEDILMGMTPRPVRVLATTYDFFPIEGTRCTVERCKRLWAMCGKPDLLDLVEDRSTHMYSSALAKASAEFFVHHLLGRKPNPGFEGVKQFEPSQLWSTRSGQVREEFSDARFVHHENRDRLYELEKARAALPPAQRKERVLDWLRQRVTSHRKPCPMNLRVYQKDAFRGLAVEMGLWWAQEGIFNHAQVFRDVLQAGKTLPVTIAVWDGGTTSLHPHIAWIRSECEAGRAVMVLNTSGVGAIMPNPMSMWGVNDTFGSIYVCCDNLEWLDDDLAAMRTFDVTRAMDVLAEWPGLDVKGISLYAHGRQGVYAQFAGVLDGRAKKVVVEAGMGSYANWVSSRYYDTHDVKSIIMHGMLKRCDLPDIERWTEERK